MGSSAKLILRAANVLVLAAAACWILALPLFTAAPGLIGVLGFNIGFAQPNVPLYYAVAVLYVFAFASAYYTFVHGIQREVAASLMATALAFACLACVLEFAAPLVWEFFCYKWLIPVSLIPSVKADGLRVSLFFIGLWLLWALLLRRQFNKLNDANSCRRFAHAFLVASFLVLAVAGIMFIRLLALLRGVGIGYCWFGSYTATVLAGTVFLWALSLEVKYATSRTAQTGNDKRSCA